MDAAAFVAAATIPHSSGPHGSHPSRRHGVLRTDAGRCPRQCPHAVGDRRDQGASSAPLACARSTPCPARVQGRLVQGCRPTRSSADKMTKVDSALLRRRRGRLLSAYDRRSSASVSSCTSTDGVTQIRSPAPWRPELLNEGRTPAHGNEDRHDDMEDPSHAGPNSHLAPIMWPRPRLPIRSS